MSPDERLSIFTLDPQGRSQTVLPCAHRATFTFLNHPSKLAGFTFPEMVPVMVPLWPSNKHILIVRVLLGEKDCLAAPFTFF